MVIKLSGSLADPGAGKGRTIGSKSFISMQFSAIFFQNNRLSHPPRELGLP